MAVTAIINPLAGASSKRAEVRTMIARLRAAGVEVDARVTTASGEARRLGAQAAERARRAGQGQAAQQLRAVIAVGGDGTVREVAEGLAGSTVPMIIWPTGTENLVAKSLGFRADADLMLACVSAGRTIPVDLGIANGRAFLVVAGVGFDAEVVQRLTRRRSGYITHLTYGGPLWRTFWEHRFPALRVMGDGQIRWQGRGMVFIGNMPRYSLGLRVIRDARHDDGLLDVIAFPCRGRLGLIGHSLRAVVRRHVEHGRTWYGRFRRIRVESGSGVPIELDGEASGRLPLDVTIRPQAIRFRVPPASVSG